MNGNNSREALGAGCLTAAMLALLVTGCAQPAPAREAAAPKEVFYVAQDKDKDKDKEETGLSGSQLWSQNCSQCHYSRSPTALSDAQWEVAMLHMRVQAYLTGEEERKILEFLKASN